MSLAVRLQAGERTIINIMFWLKSFDDYPHPFTIARDRVLYIHNNGSTSVCCPGRIPGSHIADDTNMGRFTFTKYQTRQQGGWHGWIECCRGVAACNVACSSECDNTQWIPEPQRCAGYDKPRLTSELDGRTTCTRSNLYRPTCGTAVKLFAAI